MKRKSFSVLDLRMRKKLDFFSGIAEDTSGFARSSTMSGVGNPKEKKNRSRAPVAHTCLAHAALQSQRDGAATSFFFGGKGDKNPMKNPEVAAKNAAAHRGKKRPAFSAEWKAALSAAHMGIPMSAETRAKMSAAQKGNHNSLGYKHTPETRARMSAAKRGDKNHSWRGGVSLEPYGPSFDNVLREEIRRRDGHICQLCGVPQIECDRKLHIHHIDYNKRNDSRGNLVSLCQSCHSRTTLNRDLWNAHVHAPRLVRPFIWSKP